MTLITGGGSGIGAATAEMLSAAGHSVVICGRRRDALEAVAARCGAIPVVADVADEAEIGTAVRSAVDRFGRLDGLVLNAGLGGSGTVADLAPSVWAAVLDTNLTGAYLTVRAAIGPLLASRGAIVSVASVAAMRAPTASVAYAVSKAGLVALARSLAVDHGPAGVRSNVVCPGWTRSEMADREMDELAALGGGAGNPDARQGAYEEATRLVPLRRPAESREVAEAIAWLLSPASSYLNGAVLAVDGGLTAVDPGTVAYDFRITPRP